MQFKGCGLEFGPPALATMAMSSIGGAVAAYCGNPIIPTISLVAGTCIANSVMVRTNEYLNEKYELKMSTHLFMLGATNMIIFGGFSAAAVALDVLGNTGLAFFGTISALATAPLIGFGISAMNSGNDRHVSPMSIRKLQEEKRQLQEEVSLLEERRQRLEKNIPKLKKEMANINKALEKLERL